MLLPPATPNVNVGRPHGAWHLRPPELKMSTLSPGVWGCKARRGRARHSQHASGSTGACQTAAAESKFFSVRGGRILFVMAWTGQGPLC